jgi:hypothetical protein
MKMKKRISYILILSIFSAIAWMSCQKIDEPLVIVDQKDFPELPDPDDTTTSDTLNYASIYVNHKQVLLEDFTGHLCVNCPEAGELAHDIAVENNHKLIIYAVHAGAFAEPIPGTVLDADFRTEVGNRLNTDYSIFANPLAMINRVEFGGMRQIFMDNWETAVNDELAKPNVANMKLSNTWYPSLSVVKVDVETEFLAQPDGLYKLVVYIVEDNIVAAQLNNDPNLGGDTLYNYQHRNILRDAVNSTYGDFIGETGEVTTTEIYTNEYTYPVNSDWVTENCNIIAYIGKYDASLNLIDIVQVAELAIKVDE